MYSKSKETYKSKIIAARLINWTIDNTVFHVIDMQILCGSFLNIYPFLWYISLLYLLRRYPPVLWDSILAFSNLILYFTVL